MTEEELKQEAKEYAKPWKDSLAYVSIKEAYLASAEPRERRIAELEKENAELKADNDARKFAMAMSEKVEKQLREQLNEAKEIIRELLEWEDRSDYGEHLYQSYPELLSKAEAFMNGWCGARGGNII